MQASADSSTALSSALARLDPLQARWQAIVRRSGKLQEGLQPRTDESSPSHLLRLTVHGAASKIDIALSAGQWPQLLPLRDLQDSHRRDAATNLLLADITAQLRNAGCPVESVSGLSDAATSWRNDPRRIAIRLGPFEVDLLPDEHAKPLARALEAALIERMPIATRRLLQWPLRTCVALGARRMARARLAALRPGDAVFGGFTDQVHLRIVSAKSRTWLAQARIDKQDKIMITDPFGEEVTHDFEAIPERDGYTTVSAAEAEDGGLRALARLPMEIRYEIDGPDLTVSEAAELTPGDVLVLPVPVDGAVVRLRCQGRTIARGEMVNVGGQLGVRITEAGERT